MGTTVTYTYLCEDGFWRTRCLEHAKAAKGTRYGRSPHFPIDKAIKSINRCVECDSQPATAPNPQKGT